MNKIKVTNEEILKGIEEELEQQIKLISEKELPKELQEPYEKVVNIQQESVKELASNVQKDLDLMIVKVRKSESSHIKFLDYWRYYQADYHDFTQCKAGKKCKYKNNWVNLEVNEELTEKINRPVGISLMDLMDIDDFAYLDRMYSQTLEQIEFEIVRTHQKKYMHLACLHLEEQGYFKKLVDEGILKLPFYVSMGVDSDNDGGNKNPVVYVLNP